MAISLLPIPKSQPSSRSTGRAQRVRKFWMFQSAQPRPWGAVVYERTTRGPYVHRWVRVPQFLLEFVPRSCTDSPEACHNCCGVELPYPTSTPHFNPSQSVQCVLIIVQCNNQQRLHCFGLTFDTILSLCKLKSMQTCNPHSFPISYQQDILSYQIS